MPSGCILKFKENGYALTGAGTTDAAVQACSNCQGQQRLAGKPHAKTMIGLSAAGLALAWRAPVVGCLPEPRFGLAATVLNSCVATLTGKACAAP